MSRPIRDRAGHLGFPIVPKEDVEILLPLKLRWIPFSGFRGTVNSLWRTDVGRRISHDHNHALETPPEVHSKARFTHATYFPVYWLLGIESHFVGVHGPYELHRKEKQIKCTALAVHENLLFFPMQFIWPVNTDKMRFNTYIYIF